MWALTTCSICVIKDRKARSPASRLLRRDALAVIAIWYASRASVRAATGYGKPAVGTPQDIRTQRFTEREQQVLSCVFEGLANKQIAARTGVLESSVKATLQQLFSKTGVRTRSQLVRIVLEQHRDQL